MKITHTTDLSLSSLLPTTSSSQKHLEHTSLPKTHPDLQAKHTNRKPTRRIIFIARTPSVRPRKAGAPGSGSQPAEPPTPLLQWKFEDAEETVLGNRAEKSPEGVDVGGGGKAGGEAVSARKLASALWRLQASDLGAGERGEEERRRWRKNEDPLGFKHGGAAHVSDWLARYHNCRGVGNEAKDLHLPWSSCSVSGPVDGYTCVPQTPFQLSNYAMEGATKWDPIPHAAPEERTDVSQLCEQNLNAVSKVCALQGELKEAQVRIDEVESERQASKKNLEHFLKKLSEERALWKSREREKVRGIMEDLKSDLHRERKNRQRLEIVNSKLVTELTESKQLAKKLLLEVEKERKKRKLVEEVCDELTKEIGERKAEVDALKNECLRIREEVDDERRMLQMAEVWREERVQMKLIDAKVTLEDKFAQMNVVLGELEKFTRLDPNSWDAGMLLKVAGSVKIQDIKELVYEPPKLNDINSVFEEMAMTSEREIQPCVAADSLATQYSSKIHIVSPEEAMNLGEEKIYRVSSGYKGSENGSSEEDNDRSGWETESHADGGSNDSAVGSVSYRKMMIVERDSSDVSETKWEEKRDNENLITAISEVCSSKIKSVSKLWKSEGVNGGKFSNGRVSVGGGCDAMPLEKGDLATGQWCLSPDTWSENSLVGGRGRKGGGCIEWPRGGGHRSSLKAKLMEARVESQKIQLRQVLKHKY